MPTSARVFHRAIAEKKALALHRQATVLRRYLKCGQWMHSTGPDHRICNVDKGIVYSPGLAGKRVRV